VDAVFDNGTVRLVTIDENRTSFLVNGHRLKLYHHPTSKDAFIKHLSDTSGLMVVGALQLSLLRNCWFSADVVTVLLLRNHRLLHRCCYYCHYFVRPFAVTPP
jgi:hypothetical protein